MATPENTLITRAEITSASSLANRKAFVLDGLTIELGDTGLRDVTAYMNMTWIESGRVLLARVGDMVELSLVDILIKAGAPAALVVQNNVRVNQQGFYPPYGRSGRAVATSGTGTASGGAGLDMFVNSGLGVVLYGAQPGVTYQASLAWKTEAVWPASLPGVADGQPIGV